MGLLKRKKVFTFMRPQKLKKKKHSEQDNIWHVLFYYYLTEKQRWISFGSYLYGVTH